MLVAEGNMFRMIIIVYSIYASYLRSSRTSIVLSGVCLCECVCLSAQKVKSIDQIFMQLGTLLGYMCYDEL